MDGKHHCNNRFLKRNSRFAVLLASMLFGATVVLAAQICTTASIGPNEFKGISGSSDTNVIAVGKSGEIQQFNGTTWNAMTSPTTQNLEDVEVADASTAFAVGKAGTILQWNGTAWSTHTGVTGNNLKGVWAASATEAYVVGKDGTLFAYNGTMWTNQSAAAAVGAQDLEDAWGDANSFYALGKNGTLYQFNRGTSTWSAPDTLCAAAGTKFKDLWGDGAGNIYFASDNGVYLNNGTSCTLVAASTEKLEGIYGSTTTGEIYAVGKKGVVMFFDGASWTETTEGTEDLKDAWVSSAGNAYYAGKNGQTSTCTFTAGTTCTTTIIPGESEFKGISGSSDTNVIAVGKSGEIQQFNGTTWNAMTSPTTQNLEDVEVADASTAFAVGKAGTILQWNGTAWSTHTGVTGNNLKGVWAASATEAYVVGKDGTLFAYNGTMWTNQSAAAAVGAQDLEDAWGDANSFYALGKNGTLYQFNRGTSTWSAPDTLCAAAGTKFKDLWGDGAGNIYFASDNGVYLNNGTSCTLVAASTEKLEGIYGSTTTGEIYAVGKKGVVMFFDGASWTETTEGTEDLKDAWVSSAGNAYFTGKGGQMLNCSKSRLAHHFLIGHDGAGINCVAEPITLTAQDASNTAVIAYTGSITLDTQTGKGTWTLTSGNGTFTDATLNDGLATYTYDVADNGVAMFNLDYQEGSSPIDILITDGTATDDNSDGLLGFSPSGFTVTANVLTNPPPSSINDPIANQTAGTNFAIHLTAFGQTPTDPVCGVIESYMGTKTLKFWSSYNEPVTGTLQVTIDVNPIATVEGSAIGQNVIFSNGQAQVTAKYKDVGRIRINMKDDTVTEPVGGIHGTSNLFVVRPDHFDLTVIQRTSDNSPNPAAVNAAGPVFMAAGDDFSVTVTVRDAEGSATPNYGLESTAESVLLTPTIVAAGGANNPAIQSTTGFATFTNGVATATDFSWGEVGIITLTPSIGDGDYLGADDVTGTASGNVGRFIPFDFDVSLNTPQFATACGTFSYVGQSFTYATAPVFTVSARNKVAATTQNYTGAFWKITDAVLAASGNKIYATAAGILDLGLVPTPDPVIADGGNGTGTLSFNDGGGIAFMRGASQAPFDAEISLSLNVVDGDSVFYGDGAGTSLNPAIFGDASAGNGMSFDNGKQQRWGRVAITSATGSELLPVNVPLTSEYFDGTSFVANNADNCTAMTLVSGVLLSNPDTAGGVQQPGNTAMTILPGGSTSITSANPSFISGASQLVFSAPGAGNTGFVDIEIDLTSASLDWLLFDWDGDGNHDNHPAGRATFGIFSGSREIIYIREPW